MTTIITASGYDSAATPAPSAVHCARDEQLDQRDVVGLFDGCRSKVDDTSIVRSRVRRSRHLRGMYLGHFVLVLVSGLLSSCSKTSPPADGTAVYIGRHPASRLSNVVTDDEGSTWFLVEKPDRGPAIVCRLIDPALTCAIVPGSVTKEDAEPIAQLLDVGPGATPVIAVSGDGMTRYLRPFSWEELRRLEYVFGQSQGIVWSDGTIMHVALDKVRVASPGQELRDPGWFPDNVGDLHISSSAAVWTEFVKSQDHRLMTAPLTASGLGAPRELTRLTGRWRRTCREGNTLGFLGRDGRDEPDEPEFYPFRLFMIDLVSGELVRSDPEWFDYLHCRRGSVAARSYLGIGMRCDAQGCTSQFVDTDVQGLGYNEVVLVDDAIMMVSTKMTTREVVTTRATEAPRTFRIAGGESYGSPDLRADGRGALVLYPSDHVLLALDHHGAPRPLVLTWLGEPLPKRLR